MPDMVELSTGLPEVRLAPGETLSVEGSPSGPIWVLVEGALTVSRGGVEVNAVNRVGAVIGEVAVLLGTDHVFTFVASAPSLLRRADDGAAFLASDPAVLRQVAEGLARRLNFVSTYLVDLKVQYGDAPGLSMVSDVLETLSHHEQPHARPGSARDPDPAY